MKYSSETLGFIFFSRHQLNSRWRFWKCWWQVEMPLYSIHTEKQVCKVVYEINGKSTSLVDDVCPAVAWKGDWSTEHNWYVAILKCRHNNEFQLVVRVFDGICILAFLLNLTFFILIPPEKRAFSMFGFNLVCPSQSTKCQFQPLSLLHSCCCCRHRRTFAFQSRKSDLSDHLACPTRLDISVP